jgi:hypothetical protein
MMKISHVMLLATLALAACGKSGTSSKPILEKDRQTLEQAKQLNGLQQQNTEQQKQAVDQQTQ